MAPPSSVVLVKQRSLLRDSATTVISEARQALDAQSPTTTVRLETLSLTLQSIRTSLQQSDSEILQTLTEETDIDAELAQSVTLQSKLTSTIAELQATINSIQYAASVTATSPGTSQVTEPSIMWPRLPKLELTKFSGDPLGWVPFWDDFRVSVHERSDMTVITKFKYLRGCLEGEAWDTVKGFALAESNYKEVIGLLQERFGDEQLAIFAHFQALLNLPAATTNQISQLRRVYDQCETHFRSLSALGCDEQTFSVVFIPILLWKLPKYVNIDLQRANGGKSWTLDNLRKLLREEISARDRGERTFGGSIQTSSKNYSKPKAEVPSAASCFLTTLQDRSGKPRKPKQSWKPRTPKCAFCNDSHFSDRCPTFADIDARSSQIGSRCRRCLNQNHNDQTCSRIRPCCYCDWSDHNRALRPQQFAKQVTSVPTQVLNVEADGSKPRISSLGVQLGDQKAVMLTAQATMLGPRGSVGGRCIFDNGSTRSFITKDKVRELGAEVVDRETSTIGRFKELRRRTATYDIVEVGMRQTTGKTLTLRLCVVDLISSPIVLYPFDRGDAMFSGLDLAEPPVEVPKLVAVDVLLGLDYYYAIVGSEQRSSQSSGITLTSSGLGWLAGGTVESALPQTQSTFLISQSLCNSAIADRAALGVVKSVTAGSVNAVTRQASRKQRKQRKRCLQNNTSLTSHQVQLLRTMTADFLHVSSEDVLWDFGTWTFHRKMSFGLWNVVGCAFLAVAELLSYLLQSSHSGSTLFMGRRVEDVYLPGGLPMDRTVTSSVKEFVYTMGNQRTSDEPKFLQMEEACSRDLSEIILFLIQSNKPTVPRCSP